MKRLSPLEFRIIQLLATQKMYGLEIKKEIEKRDGDVISQGTLYPTLHRMYKKGFLDASWGDPDEQFSGARRKYYTISSEGVAMLNKYQNLNTGKQTSIAVGGLVHQ